MGNQLLDLIYEKIDKASSKFGLRFDEIYYDKSKILMGCFGRYLWSGRAYCSEGWCDGSVESILIGLDDTLLIHLSIWNDIPTCLVGCDFDIYIPEVYYFETWTKKNNLGFLTYSDMVLSIEKIIEYFEKEKNSIFTIFKNIESEFKEYKEEWNCNKYRVLKNIETTYNELLEKLKHILKEYKEETLL